MKRKALFFDIDGTLLVDASKELPKSAALALTEARRAGHLVFINSGQAGNGLLIAVSAVAYDQKHDSLGKGKAAGPEFKCTETLRIDR